SMILDGEIVAFDKSVTSFSKLQGRIHVKDSKKALKSGIKIYYYVFDILYLDKYDLRKIPLRDRKKILKTTVNFKDNLRYTSHRNHYGKKYLKQACKKGWEGLIAKKGDSNYESKRTRNWLKFKCVNEQELVIGGYTEPKGHRKGFGSLLLGYYKSDKLQYAGQVGTGFNDELLEKLRKKLEQLQKNSSPFDEKISKKDIHWVKPKLVCEVGFTEWTRTGKLRHPRFLGLRRDKPAKKVVRED
ncbi:MAG: non-homologous end-joining DNA ligase, partial [Nitrosopumilaceae archaeon]|nr:non-homologous end-joining DNA ligase [Nitrosopumilaceae archaeon]